MINHLNELSSVYMQNIAEGCGCDEKKDKKESSGKMKRIPVMPAQMSSVDGGNHAKPGPDKNYVKPMATEEKKPLPQGKMSLKAFNKDVKASKEKDIGKKNELENQARMIRMAQNDVKEGHCDVEGVECSPTEKKKDAKRMKKESAYSNWRDDSQDLLEFIGGGDVVSGNGYGGGVEKNLKNPVAKTDTKANERITEKKVKNKIIINPPQGMTEAFGELGGVVTEMYEITEKIDIEKADMGDVVDDFYKSDAPQFKGKSKKKRQQMAVAAKLSTEETEEEKKKRELVAKTKDHDDKRSGKLAEADMTGAPSIKDAKPAKKTNVKYDPHMKVMAPTVKKEGALSGVISTIRSRNGMKDVTAKKADKRQAKKERNSAVATANADFVASEEMSVKDQMAATIKYNKMNPRKPYKAGDGYKRNQRNAAANAARQPKDTRTDAQKMSDATGPRPGSNYRGD